MTPEAKARQTIDALLTAAGWHVCNLAEADIHATQGVAIREFPLNTGHGFADYLLYVNGKAAGVIDAKKEAANATTQAAFGIKWIRKIQISLPSVSDQRRTNDEIDRRLSIVSEVEAEVDANLKRAQALRQVTLAKAFATDQ